MEQIVNALNVAAYALRIAIAQMRITTMTVLNTVMSADEGSVSIVSTLEIKVKSGNV